VLGWDQRHRTATGSRCLAFSLKKESETTLPLSLLIAALRCKHK